MLLVPDGYQTPGTTRCDDRPPSGVMAAGGNRGRIPALEFSQNRKMMQILSNDRQVPLFQAAGIRLFAGGIVLLVLALGFSALLTYGSIERLYVASLVANYQVVGKDLQRKLEQSLRFGKSIQKFIGMNVLLDETQRRLKARIDTPDSSNVPESLDAQEEASPSISVALPSGTILYSADESLTGTEIPREVRRSFDAADSPGHPKLQKEYVEYRGSYYVTLPVRDREKAWVATIVLGFDKAQVERLLHGLILRELQLIAMIALSCVILLPLAFRLLVPEGPRGSSRKSVKIKIYSVFIVIVGSAQIIFSVYNLKDYRTYLLQITREQVQTLILFLKEDIEYLFSKGIQIDHLVKMDVVMSEILAASPELEGLIIVDSHEKPLYRATREGMTDFQKTPEAETRFSSATDSAAGAPSYELGAELLWEGVLEGRVRGTISKEAIAARIGDVLLDSATVLVISLLFLVEILILILPFLEQPPAGIGPAKVPYQTMRPAAFLFLFGVDLCISFLPLYMEHLYSPIPGVSKEIVMGLPISIRMFFTGVSILAAGTWCDRRGWHEPFLSGLVLAGLGFIYAWLAPDAWHFMVSQSVFGLGYGCSLMASQGFIVACTDESNRAQGLAQLWAGVYAGSICGGAAGAMLAERLGFGPIFFIGAVILFLIVPYTMIFMRGAICKPHEEATAAESRTFTLKQVLSFLSNRNIFSLILFSSLPTAVALVGFLNYFIPVYLNRVGTSQSNIGRVLMIYGVCLIYVAPLISRQIDSRPSRKPFIIISGILGGLAILTFSFLEGLWGITLSVFLLGLSSSFGFTSQSGYVLRLNATQELGKGRALGIYSSANRLGQVLGPITFGWLMVTIGINMGVISFGLSYLALTLIFFLAAQNDTSTTGPARQG